MKHAQADIVEFDRRSQLIDCVLGSFDPITESDGTVEGATKIVMDAAKHWEQESEDSVFSLSEEQVEQFYSEFCELPWRETAERKPLAMDTCE